MAAVGNSAAVSQEATCLPNVAVTHARARLRVNPTETKMRVHGKPARGAQSSSVHSRRTPGRHGMLRQWQGHTRGTWRPGGEPGHALRTPGAPGHGVLGSQVGRRGSPRGVWNQDGLMGKETWVLALKGTKEETGSSLSPQSRVHGCHRALWALGMPAGAAPQATCHRGGQGRALRPASLGAVHRWGHWRWSADGPPSPLGDMVTERGVASGAAFSQRFSAGLLQAGS